MGLATIKIGSRSYIWAVGSFRLSSSLVVLRANLIIISVFGFHLKNGPSLCGPDQPPSKYDVSPHLGPASRRTSCLKSDHREHQKRK